MTGTVEDGNGSIASIEVDPQISRTYTASNGKEVTEYKGYYNWTGNVFLSCGDYGANDRTYAIRVNAESGLVLSQKSALLYRVRNLTSA